MAAETSTNIAAVIAAREFGADSVRRNRRLASKSAFPVNPPGSSLNAGQACFSCWTRKRSSLANRSSKLVLSIKVT